MLQPFPTLDIAVRTLRVILPQPREGWRLVLDPVVGAINGLDNGGKYRGAAIATNGIMVLIYNPLCGSVAFGHIEWFTPDVSDEAAKVSDLWDECPTRKPKAKSMMKQAIDYIDV